MNFARYCSFQVSYCNGLSPPLADFVLFGLPLKVFKIRLLGRGFHTFIKNASFSFATDVGSHNPPSLRPSVLACTLFLLPSMWDLQSIPLWGPASLLAHCLVSTPLRGSASSLTHRLVSGFDPIYNSPSPPLVDIILFGLSLSGFPSRFLKTRLLGRDFHTLIKNASFFSPTNVGSHTSDLGIFSINRLILGFFFLQPSLSSQLQLCWSSSINSLSLNSYQCLSSAVYTRRFRVFAC